MFIIKKLNNFIVFFIYYEFGNREFDGLMIYIFYLGFVGFWMYF